MAFAKLAQAGYTKYLVQQKLNSVEAGNEINVQVDRDKMASRTISADSGYDDANRLVDTDGKFRAGEYEYDINIKYNAFDRKALTMCNLIFMNERGEQIKLSHFASIKEALA
jgi:HAE1 family hydrophobic/amphiphilic exporter-1